jgi:hypothetical protein
MADAQPTMVPSGIDSTQSIGNTYNAPSQSPPAASSSDATLMPPAAGTQIQSPPPATQAAPTLPITGTGAGAGVSAWQNNKKIDALWTISEDRNSWMGVTTIGWRKLAPGTETSLVAMTMLAAHARATGAPINYRDESDNLVHEIYVW